MSKEELIVVRCDSKFKDLVVKAAVSKGVSTSSYVRMILNETLSNGK